jgi:hypothetical protein
MRQRTAHERHILQAGKTDIRDEFAAAAHQAVVFLAQEPCTYSLLRHTEFPRQPRNDPFKLILFLG